MYARHSILPGPSHPEKNQIVRSNSRALAVAPHSAEKSCERVGSEGRSPIEESDLAREVSNADFRVMDLLAGMACVCGSQ